MAAGRGARDLLVMLLGAGGGQLIAFVLSPVISRLFSVDDFGVFSVVNSGAMVLGAVAALRLDAAIPLPKGEGEARTVLQAALVNCLVTCGAFTISIILAGLLWEQQLELVFGFPWAYLLGVPVLGGAISLVLSFNQFAVRRGRFGAVGRRNLLSYGMGAGSQTILGLLGFGAFGLVGGMIVGYITALVSLVFDARRAVLSRLSFARLGLAYRRNLEFPRQFAPAALMSALGVYLPPMLIATSFGISAAGTFGFAHRVIALPVSLLATAVSQYYLNRLVAARRESGGTPRRLFMQTTAILSVPSVLGVLVVFVAGPWIFSTVFGGEWLESGYLGRWVALAMGAQLIASPLSQTLVVYRAAGEQLIWDASRLVLVCLTLWVLPVFVAVDLEAAISIYALTAVLTYIASWILSASKVRNSAVNRLAG